MLQPLHEVLFGLLGNIVPRGLQQLSLLFVVGGTVFAGADDLVHDATVLLGVHLTVLRLRGVVQDVLALLVTGIRVGLGNVAAGLESVVLCVPVLVAAVVTFRPFSTGWEPW